MVIRLKKKLKRGKNPLYKIAKEFGWSSRRKKHMGTLRITSSFDGGLCRPGL